MNLALKITYLFKLYFPITIQPKSAKCVFGFVGLQIQWRLSCVQRMTYWNSGGADVGLNSFDRE